MSKINSYFWRDLTVFVKPEGEYTSFKIHGILKANHVSIHIGLEIFFNNTVSPVLKVNGIITTFFSQAILHIIM